ncbi:MAG TPA: protein phosphatase 2C domain-containing protein [Vicinamibacterales bacterium]|nr:protein phosphatase 2C domain-containing protein [Vicinamibacterales bacterium]
MSADPRRVAAHGATHPGKVRRQNEDGMLVDVQLGAFAVADGMGGHNAGEVASALALETFHSFLTRLQQDPDHTWPFGLDSRLDFNGNRLRTAVKLANRRVFRESETRDQCTGMGTTIAALLVDGGCAAVCGVGDSRIYIVAPDSIECLTRDHTWVEMLLSQNPDIDPQSVAAHPMRHVLTSVLGTQDDVEVTVASMSFGAADRFLLCSDGVHGALDEERIAQIVVGAPSVKDAAERLVAEALERDGRDNLTAVVVGAAA